MDGARLIYFMIAGVDFIPLGELPREGCAGGATGGGPKRVRRQRKLNTRRAKTAS